MPVASKVRSVKLDLIQGVETRLEEYVALEAPISIYLNGEHVITLFATPAQQRELAVGYLVGEGILPGVEHIVDVEVKEGAVHVAAKGEVKGRMEAARKIKLVTTSCGSVEDFYRLLDSVEKPEVRSGYRVAAEEIVEMTRTLNELSPKRKTQLAVHSACLFTGGELTCYTEDVGRHNTVDKIVGLGLGKGVDFSRSVLLTTGRQASDMVLKAARVGIPISATIRGPLYSGIFAAWKTGVTAVAFARGPRMTVYTYPERILKPKLEVRHASKEEGARRLEVLDLSGRVFKG